MTWVVTAKTKFYLHDDETLLEGLLRTGHNIEFQCKQGYCGSCRLKVTYSSQPITYPIPPLAMIENGDVLSCCCALKGVIHLKTVD